MFPSSLLVFLCAFSFFDIDEFESFYTYLLPFMYMFDILNFGTFIIHVDLQQEYPSQRNLCQLRDSSQPKYHLSRKHLSFNFPDVHYAVFAMLLKVCELPYP